VHLCVMGRSATLFCGQAFITTQSIDIYLPQSTFKEADLKKACEKSGIGFNSVYPITMRVLADPPPGFPQEFPLEGTDVFENLSISTPPLGLIAAHKLGLATENDLVDAIWIANNTLTTFDDIENWAHKLTDDAIRKKALENLMLIEMIASQPREGTRS